MTVNKDYTLEQIDISAIAKALGHPARIAIMEYLASVDSCICGDIVKELPLAQSTVSQHIKALKNADLIQGNIEGNAICYCINEVTLERFKTYMKQIKSLVNVESKCC